MNIWGAQFISLPSNTTPRWIFIVLLMFPVLISTMQYPDIIVKKCFFIYISCTLKLCKIMLGADYTYAAWFWCDFVVADTVSGVRPEYECRERPTGLVVWHNHNQGTAVWHPGPSVISWWKFDHIRMFCILSRKIFDSSYNVFLDVPSITMIDPPLQNDDLSGSNFVL